jgi:uncharacterized protein (TIGR00730 family)
LSDYLVVNNFRLVNGGGSIGLMGVMADRVLARGGEAVGVIPVNLKEREVAHLGMTQLIVVPDMHTRKLTVVNLSDAFVVLPGGYGTLDEMFETLTWLQLHLHHKPIGLLNVDGYFDPLLEMLDKMVSEGFLKTGARNLLQSDSSIPGLFARLNGPVEYHDLKWERENFH